MKSKITKFLINDLNNDIDQSLKYISNIDNVEEIICLPDISLKEKYKNLGYKIDFPSSIAIVTNKDKIYPQLNARGINCGIAMMKVELDPKDKRALEKLEKVILKINKGFLYNLFYKYHLPLIDKYNLVKEEMVKISEEGINYLIKKFNLDEDVKINFEDNGHCFLSSDIRSNKYIYKRWLNGPKSLIKKVGRNFGGNHFLEIQVLDKIYDKDFTSKFKITENNIYIMYHTAGYGLESVANKDFCRKHIFKKEIVGISDEEEKELTMDLYKILMNFSYTYRLMTYIILRNEINKEFRNINVEFITDTPHNTVRETENSYIYRRNATQLSKNRLSILAGSYNSNSYLITAGDRANISKYTADHGSGIFLDKDLKNSGLEIKRYFLKKGINNYLFRKKVMLNHDNMEENPVISFLDKKEIIKPVASFRPIINFKYK